MKKLCVLILAVVFILAGCDQYANSGLEDSSSNTEPSYSAESTDAESTDAEAEEPEETSPADEALADLSTLIDSGDAFDAGDYAPGDIPTGEYAFIPFDGSSEYFGEETTSGDILDNENFDSFGYVYVSGKGNVKTGGALVNPKDFKTLGVNSAKELYEVINDESDYKGSAMYKVGVDIKAGSHTVKSDGDAYYSVLSGPVGKGDIVNNDNFSGKRGVNVSNGQYLNLSRASLEK